MILSQRTGEGLLLVGDLIGAGVWLGVLPVDDVVVFGQRPVQQLDPGNVSFVLHFLSSMLCSALKCIFNQPVGPPPHPNLARRRQGNEAEGGDDE